MIRHQLSAGIERWPVVDRRLEPITEGCILKALVILPHGDDWLHKIVCVEVTGHRYHLPYCTMVFSAGFSIPFRLVDGLIVGECEIIPPAYLTYFTPLYK